MIEVLKPGLKPNRANIQIPEKFKVKEEISGKQRRRHAVREDAKTSMKHGQPKMLTFPAST